MKIISLFIILMGLMGAVVAGANPYITVDVQTGRVLAQQDAFDRWYPASLTKLMTIYVTFRALNRGEISLDSPVRLSAAAAKLPPSRSGYRAGSVLTLDNAIKVTLVKSANDMAVAIGETVAGNLPAFVQRMNSEASRLGMIGTHFSSANGLPDPNNYSTARDIALLAVQLRREFPQYADYFNIEAIDFGDGRKIQPNSNNLIGRFAGADGMKTGFICASGFNIAASATRNNRTIIAVVLGAERIDQREGLAAQLIENGFKTQGTPTVTLANLRPYGVRLSQATNLYDRICNKQAWQARMQYRDDAGKTIFNSPFIDALTPNLKVVKIKLISTPSAVKSPAQSKKLNLGKVPVPRLRPAKS